MEKTLQRDGCEIHYWMTPEPKGPWLVFLHGAGADHRTFDEQVPAVEDRCGLLLWDARGHGRSRPARGRFCISQLADDLLAILEREGIGRATIVGHSMGGSVAQEIAFRHPDRVDALVLIDCFCNTWTPSPTAHRMPRAAPRFLWLFPWRLLVRWTATFSSMDPDVRRYLRDAVRAVGKRNFIRFLAATAACFHDEPDYRIPVPSLLVVGERDRLDSIRNAAPLWSRREPRCALRRIPHAGHFAHQDHPKMFNGLMLSFLEDNVFKPSGQYER
jgi:pimeloyl-ACP methyl ester carboxylesterase